MNSIEQQRPHVARSKPSGTLKHTASVAFAHECIVPHLQTFHRSYPEVSIELLPTDANLEIAAAAIDLAIRLAPTPAGGLISTRLMTTRHMVCASPEYVKVHPTIGVPEDLIDHDCLRFALPEFRKRWRFRMDTGEETEIAASGRTIIANALSLREAARNGLGPVLLADWLVAADIHDGRLVHLLPEYACTATEFGTAALAHYPSRAFLPQKVRVMIDFLRDRVGSQ